VTPLLPLATPLPTLARPRRKRPSSNRSLSVS
jgi:hypothetical protein